MPRNTKTAARDCCPKKYPVLLLHLNIKKLILLLAGIVPWDKLWQGPVDGLSVVER